MKKVVLALALITSGFWLSTSSLLLAGLSTSSDTSLNLAYGTEDDKNSYRPAEFSAEVNLNDYKDKAVKLDVNVQEKLNKAKKDMLQVCGTRIPAAVR